jgi:hypothetical protein
MEVDHVQKTTVAGRLIRGDNGELCAAQQPRVAAQLLGCPSMERAGFIADHDGTLGLPWQERTFRQLPPVEPGTPPLPGPGRIPSGSFCGKSGAHDALLGLLPAARQLCGQHTVADVAARVFRIGEIGVGVSPRRHGQVAVVRQLSAEQVDEPQSHEQRAASFPLPRP